jgi:hypothetical protein
MSGGGGLVCRAAAGAARRRRHLPPDPRRVFLRSRYRDWNSSLECQQTKSLALSLIDEVAERSLEVVLNQVRAAAVCLGCRSSPVRNMVVGGWCA